MMRFIIAFPIFLLVFSSLAQEYNIIPFPAQLNVGKEQLELNADITIINTQDESRVVAELLAQYLQERKIKSSINNSPKDNQQIVLQLINEASLSEEGYILLVNKNGISLLANTSAGLFYATQTLMQMLPPTNNGKLAIQHVQITDQPRFAWRGLHLDVSRHFFSIDFIKKYIDLMAMYKMNTFHWHLTEDQGWRIEIKKYPLLTEIGSQRKETILEKNFNPYKGDGKAYGGFYTQEEIKEVVAYAADRYITVVPEIEMPGHALAALAGYPHLGCTGGPYEVGTVWGVYDDVFCAGNDSTFIFLQDILDEVMALFPSTYIHIGGDECPKTRWKECTKCQARIKAEGLADEHELQSYFIQRVEKHLNNKGRKLIGWDEILEGGLAPNATVMSWRGEAGGIQAAQAGHQVVMTPSFVMYFDHYQGDPAQEPLAICCYSDLQKVYRYEPVPASLNEEEAERVLGAQANVWTEYMKTEAHVEYMVLPRMLALSETVWTDPARKNWTNFQKRLPHHFEMLSNKSVNFRIPEPAGPGREMVIMNESTEITFMAPFKQAQIYYTDNGTRPTSMSKKYEGPIKITLERGEKKTIQAITIYDERQSIVSMTSIERQEAMEGIEHNALVQGVKNTIFEGVFESITEITNGNLHEVSFSNFIAIPENANILNGFGMIIEAYIKIDHEAVYSFHLGSDDGSQLYINNKLIVDNDGLHSFNFESGQISLAKGYHPIKLFYFDAGGDKKLELEWASAGSDRVKLDSTKLYYSKQ